MAKLDGLIAEVEEVRGTVASAIVLIQGLAQQIKDAGTDQAALDEIVAQLDAQQQALAAAVAAHSEPVVPDEPTPEPEPEPEPPVDPIDEPPVPEEDETVD